MYVKYALCYTISIGRLPELPLFISQLIFYPYTLNTYLREKTFYNCCCCACAVSMFSLYLLFQKERERLRQRRGRRGTS
ncbi:hypothetical protein F4775DRAFT_540563 [Biscogniauxia sp. FL1348]|nr:hypothetical protein F4775DRAFT_540563 [Biscogniauxia sp. FL1348]